jgi:4'-phosphopantetheinyl transferase
VTGYKGSTLAPNEVAIFMFDVDRLICGLGQTVLNPTEWRRAMALRDPNAVRRYILGRALTRDVLARYVGGIPRQLQLESDPGGKPLPLLGPPLICFSISHSEGIHVIAVTQMSHMGVDVEAPRSRALVADLEPLICHPLELAALPATREARASALLRLWVGKEAYLKAMGTGLRTDPSNVRLDVRGEMGLVGGHMAWWADVVGCARESQRWLVQGTTWNDGTVSAVCAERPFTTTTRLCDFLAQIWSHGIGSAQ